RQRINDGLAVATATGFGLDGCTVSSLPAVMTLACLHSGLSLPEAVTAATINAAFALNAADRIGSLAPGKFADLLLLDAGDYREICLQLGSNLVHSVMRRGEWQDFSSTTPPMEPIGSSVRAS